MQSKRWFFLFLAGVILILGVSTGIIAYIDPFFHYHLPHTDKFFYPLNSQRSQNDGITKHFDYDAIVTGTSMTENFKTTEVDTVFGVHSVKLPYSGGSFKEINDNLIVALKVHPDLKLVIRALDRKFLDDKDMMRNDLGSYPTYLYNNNPFDDVRYLWNKDVLMRCYYMLGDKRDGEAPGMTSFDRYGYWMPNYIGQFGSQTVLKDMNRFHAPKETLNLTAEEKETIYATVTQNITSLPLAYPDTTFYYFLPPYSAANWGESRNKGTLDKTIDVEQYAIELILDCDNIRLYSFSAMPDITTDLNNYKDTTHYGEWINSRMLHMMKDGTGLLTKENYSEYIASLRTLYENFDYNALFTQEDLEDAPADLKN